MTSDEQSFKMEQVPIEQMAKTNEIVSFDVGGTVFKTTLSTLRTQEPENLFLSLYENSKSGKFLVIKDKENIFIDRNPQTIQRLFDYLRTGNVPLPLDDHIKDDIGYFQFTNLVSLLQAGGNDIYLDRKRKYDSMVQTSLDEEISQYSSTHVLIVVTYDNALFSLKEREMTNLSTFGQMHNWRVVVCDSKGWIMVNGKAGRKDTSTYGCIMIHRERYTYSYVSSWYEAALSFAEKFSDML